MPEDNDLSDLLSSPPAPATGLRDLGPVRVAAILLVSIVLVLGGVALGATRGSAPAARALQASPDVTSPRAPRAGPITPDAWELPEFGAPGGGADAGNEGPDGVGSSSPESVELSGRRLSLTLPEGWAPLLVWTDTATFSAATGEAAVVVSVTDIPGGAESTDLDALSAGLADAFAGSPRGSMRRVEFLGREGRTMTLEEYGASLEVWWTVVDGALVLATAVTDDYTRSGEAEAAAAVVASLRLGGAPA